MENVDPSSISTQSLVYKTYVENVTEAGEGVEQKNNSSYYWDTKSSNCMLSPPAS